MKRGEIEVSLVLLLGLIIFAVVALFFFGYAKQVAEKTLFEKRFLARDLALVLNTVQSVPGDVTLYYVEPSANLSRFRYHFENKLVTLSDSPNEVGTRVSYPFFTDSSLVSSLPSLDHPSQLVFIKTAHALHVSDHEDTALVERLSCSRVSQLSLSKETLVLDSGDQMNSALVQVTDYLEAKSDFAKTTRTWKTELPENLYAQRLSLIEKDTSLVFGLDIQDGDAITVVYPTDASSEQSKKLACLLLDQLAQNFPDAVLTSRPQQSSDDFLRINSEGLAVVVVLGDESSVFADPSRLGSSLFSGIQEYFKSASETNTGVFS